MQNYTMQIEVLVPDKMTREEVEKQALEYIKKCPFIVSHSGIAYYSEPMGSLEIPEEIKTMQANEILHEMLSASH